MALAMTSPCYAAGLNTSFSEVTLEGLEVGRPYSTKEAAGLPLIVVNTGKEPVDLKMEFLTPDVSELKDGYEAIPDLTWVRLDKYEFKNIKSQQAAVTDVVISVPPGEQYKGKKYQIFIWSHTVGRAIGVGLKSKLLFSIKGEEDA